MFCKKLFAAAALFVSFGAQAQSFDQPIRFIVPFGAGGATDVLARLIAPKISDALKQPVYVENRPGANGQIGAQFVRNAPPDGSVLMVTTEHPVVILPAMMDKPPYAGDDFVILGKIANLQWALSTASARGTKNLGAFVDHVRKHPADGNYGVPSDGGIPQMIGAVIGKTAGIDMTVVPYAGAGPMMPHLMGGQIGSGVTGAPEAVNMLKAGKVDVLGISGQRRSAHLPDVPTFAEQGYAGLDVDSWFGAFAPKGLPAPMAQAFNKALRDALDDPDVRRKISDMSIETQPTTLEEADAAFRKDLQFWREAYAR